MGEMMRMMGGQSMELPEGIPASELPEPDSRGARLEALPSGAGREVFTRICSRCHALPDPGQHEPGAWPAVVERMRGHMDRMEVEAISDAEAERVVRYLQAASDRER